MTKITSVEPLENITGTEKVPVGISTEDNTPAVVTINQIRDHITGDAQSGVATDAELQAEIDARIEADNDLRAEVDIEFFNAQTQYAAGRIFDFEGGLFEVVKAAPDLSGFNDGTYKNYLSSSAHPTRPLRQLSLTNLQIAEKIAAAQNTGPVGPQGIQGIPGKDGADGTTLPDATTTVKGKVELATNFEALAGADTTRAVTPSGLERAIRGTVISHLANVPAISGQGGKFLAVDRAGTNVELVNAPSGGNVSVATTITLGTADPTGANREQRVLFYGEVRQR